MTCVICQTSLYVYDKYPLIDGSFFLSPLRYNSDLQVVFEHRLLYLNAVCMRWVSYYYNNYYYCCTATITTASATTTTTTTTTTTFATAHTASCFWTPMPTLGLYQNSPLRKWMTFEVICCCDKKWFSRTFCSWSRISYTLWVFLLELRQGSWWHYKVSFNRSTPLIKPASMSVCPSVCTYVRSAHKKFLLIRMKFFV